MRLFHLRRLPLVFLAIGVKLLHDLVIALATFLSFHWSVYGGIMRLRSTFINTVTSIGIWLDCYAGAL
jgi:hypothetical protein